MKGRFAGRDPESGERRYVVPEVQEPKVYTPPPPISEHLPRRIRRAMGHVQRAAGTRRNRKAVARIVRTAIKYGIRPS